MTDPKADLHQYLRAAREAVLWKLEGLSEYDVRRPLTPTGTNLLGVVKHLAILETEYFGLVFGRPFTGSLHYDEDEPNSDLWATADESREDVVAFYRRAGAHADATIEELDLDARADVPWWGEERRHAALHLVLVHMVAETNRHAGQFDVLREQLDGAVGHRREVDNMAAPGDEAAWAAHRARLEDLARRFRRDAGV
ncbi:DinB family protein [Saccharothrix xinjiangensis]|uniref:DinB family protein n=1 Tax=Saccharothrix xinjiangensis TaxID=204798 RepID=A0ABV9XYW6_9PSEU